MKSRHRVALAISMVALAIGAHPAAAQPKAAPDQSGVRSRITTDRRMEISIEYRLLESGARWAVYDVVLDGVSLVSNYRSQFNSIIRTSSFADLLAKLRNNQIEAHVIPRTGRGS